MRNGFTNKKSTGKQSAMGSFAEYIRHDVFIFSKIHVNDLYHHRLYVCSCLCTCVHGMRRTQFVMPVIGCYNFTSCNTWKFIYTVAALSSPSSPQMMIIFESIFRQFPITATGSTHTIINDFVDIR